MAAEGTFAVALNCMDGRAQLPANTWLKERFGVDFIDMVTEAGIVRFCSAARDAPQTVAVLESIGVSVNAHGATQMAVIAHADCAGNPIADSAQKAQLSDAVAFLRDHFPRVDIIAVWIGPEWTCEELSRPQSTG